MLYYYILITIYNSICYNILYYSFFFFYMSII